MCFSALHLRQLRGGVQLPRCRKLIPVLASPPTASATTLHVLLLLVRPSSFPLAPALLAPTAASA